MAGRESRISLDCSLSVPASSSVQDGSHTPNTPEILNSIVNMTSGPFTTYSATSQAGTAAQQQQQQHHQHAQQQQAQAAQLPAAGPATAAPQFAAPSPGYSDTSDSSGSMASPMSPPNLSVQHYRYQKFQNKLHTATSSIPLAHYCRGCIK